MPRLTNLDLDLVRAFIAVCECQSFTRAGARLGRTQSAMSLQIRRLESQLDQTLLSRDPRQVALTEQGEAFLPLARRLIRLNDEILAGMAADDVEGEVRLGAPEDFATTHLPAVLGTFARSHPRVALSVTCDLTLNLLEQLRDGRLDLALIKREPLGPELGVRVWREPLVWVGLGPDLLKPQTATPLVVAPSPCVYRKRAITALEAAGRPWRAAYSSPSLAGQLAALRAGLGIAVLPRDMAPDDLCILRDGMPNLADAEIALLKARSAVPPAGHRLAEFILSSLDRRSGPE
ncbi:MAG: LysR family transcriptional regulator [Caulobacteraceae bacterium]|nr:LysR family transcriptional regulator [Caulobacteraceae bacterium]